MNSTQIMGIVRDIIKALGVIAVAYGYVDGGTLEMIAGVVATVAASAWSYYTNRTDQMLNNAAKSNSVKKIITTAEMADSVPSSKVVSK